jgi:hypothetical protein
MHAIVHMGYGVLMHYTIEHLHAVGTVRVSTDKGVVCLQVARVALQLVLVCYRQ